MLQHVYIPVSAKSLAAVLNAGPSFRSVLEDICIDEILGFFALQEVPKCLLQSDDPAVFEQVLAELFSIANTDAVRGEHSSFKQSLIDNIDYDKLEAGAREMYRLGLKLVNADAVQEREYIDSEGLWDFDFKDNYTSLFQRSDIAGQANNSPFMLTEEQFRIENLVEAEMGEHLHLQGYAGTGKTFLIQALLHLLEAQGTKPESILILTHTTNQLAGLSSRLRAKYSCGTFGSIVRQILPEDYWRIKNPQPYKANLSHDEIAEFYALRGVAGVTGKQLARLVHFTLKNYCESADECVCADHVPELAKSGPHKTQKQRSAISELVIATAIKFWQKIINPTSEFTPPVRVYHQIKLAALLKVTIPLGISHVIVDEAHDLSPAMLQIIDASPQCCMSFGDCYQNLNGVKNSRSGSVRERLITHSFRTGTPLAEVINPVINAHPWGPKELFHGNSEVPTCVDYYNSAKVPDKPAAIIVSDEWALWEWVQRVADKKLNYRSISSFAGLCLFVEDVLKLKNGMGRAKHGALSNFKDWNSLVKAYQHNRSFNRIFEMIERGYTAKNWAMTRARHVQSGKNLYILAKATDSRNLEFDRLMLSPDVVDMVSTDGKKRSAKSNSALYVAVTRVKHLLIAPISLREWIEEVSGLNQ